MALFSVAVSGVVGSSTPSSPRVASRSISPRSAADFEDGALYAAVAAWAVLQGQVALEALGQRPFPTADAGAVFDNTVETVLGGLTSV
ncbi:WHG domain-containing protein [Streptomyces sp. HK10]|uniref:WHG domain-containing protein n=1 Tax=Streptomyces sp. HK10 TaxID=3373255 RepID=UPI0037493BDC